MNRKQIYFTSDWHCFHENSLKFDQRPFKDLDHMHRVLINNYNACVPENGVCYFLGDIGLGNKEGVKKILSELNAIKVLIAGNHDKTSNVMYDMGFNVVLNSATLYIAGERVTMSHCPLRGVFREDITGMRNAKEGENWHGEQRHLEFSVSNEGQYHLHGHCHAGPANKKLVIDNKQFDVGVPGNLYRPVSISTIESWIARHKMGQNVNK